MPWYSSRKNSAVFENLAAFGIDEFKWTRRKSCFIFFILLAIFSLPCIFGFNLWNNFQPFGAGSNILDLEDFIVSYNLLPLGAVYLIIFCLNKIGWGADNLFAELNTGKGWKFPMWTKNYIRFVIPIVILLIWFAGIREKLF